MNALYQVPECEEIQFERWIDNGKAKVLSNREFCGLSFNQCVDWLFEQDSGRRIVCGIVRFIMNNDFKLSHAQIRSLDAQHQKWFQDYFDRYFEAHMPQIMAEAKEMQRENEEERAIAQHEARQDAAMARGEW